MSASISSKLNDDDFNPEVAYRFNIVDELELSNFVMYKKTAMDEQILGRAKSTSNFIPGIKFTSGNKGTACSLLKTLFEKGQVTTRDIITLGELENFEDKNGNGTYKASYGHDDIIMTFVQIPMVMQTGKYSSFLEDIEEARISGIINNKWNTNQQQNAEDIPFGMFTQIGEGFNQFGIEMPMS
jgi:hypothetical protein